MRIAHIDTERTWRGGQQQVQYLLRGLLSRGVENIVIARKRSAMAERLAGEGIAVNEVPAFAEVDPLSAFQVRRILSRNRIDLVHCHNAHGVSLAALATLGTHVPFVVSRRVDVPLKTHLLSRWKYRRAAHFLTVSRAIKQVLVSGGVSESRISVVYSGVDGSRFENVVPVTRKELGAADTDLIVGQVAALAPHKDQATFVKAIGILREEMPHLKACIVGDGPLRSALEDLIQRSRLGDVVRLLGFQEEPLRYLKAFDCFCLSSTEEGLGTSLLDAMSLGIPVVATRAGGIPEIIEDRVTGLLAEPGNPGDLAAGIKASLLDRDQTEAMVGEARKRVRGFNIDNLVDRTLTVYRTVLAALMTRRGSVPGTSGH